MPEHELATTSLGKSVDIYHPEGVTASAAPTVLLWHGSGPDERDVMEPLARAVAAQGVVVLVPDWRADAADGGQAELLDSLAFARDHAADGRLVVAGWSAGAPAALGVALRPETAGGRRPAAVVGIAAQYDRPARTTGTVLFDDLAAGRTADVPVPVRLVHGTQDTLEDVAYSRKFRAALVEHGWAAELTEIPADHAGSIMTEYDPAARRCRESRDPAVREAGAMTARVIAETALGI
ncbi:alpha/beta hydrolase [Streptomyces sp. NPDC001262]|uniref:alpha/beta hydrolase n=1 Tax=Streptomyces sp. NPDC001262 TaxID=3364552 RepID=UPI0036C9CFFD